MFFFNFYYFILFFYYFVVYSAVRAVFLPEIQRDVLAVVM